MANYTSRISTTAVSALNAQQAAIATTANNIANVNTPGYARRVLELEARAGDSVASGISLGSGVQVGSITRQTSAYLDELVRKAAGSNYRYEVEDSFISGVEPLFSFEGDFITIGSSLNAFYASMNDLALNPSDLSLRANVIQQADTLVNSIRTTFESIAQLQVDADNRLETELNTVNSITAQIAELNAEIRTRESTGYLAADERDQRERLLEKLAEKLSFSITNLQDGTITVSLANGFALVAGNNSRALDFSRNPSFAPGGVPQSLSSGNLGYIVYDHGGGSHQDLTGLVAAGDGSMGGLLRMRGTIAADPALSPFQADGILPDLAARVESLTRVLLVDFNQTYYAANAAGDPTAGDLDNDPPYAFGLFSWEGNPDRLGPQASLADLTPAASGRQMFSNILTVVPKSPRDICAGRDPEGDFPPTVPKGDSSNATAMAALKTKSIVFDVPGFSTTATTGELYDQLVGEVGNLRNTSRVDTMVASANLATAQQRRDEISAVSLDEEFINLVKYQRAFEAAARLIKVSDELMQQVVNLI